MMLSNVTLKKYLKYLDLLKNLIDISITTTNLTTIINLFKRFDFYFKYLKDLIEIP